MTASDLSEITKKSLAVGAELDKPYHWIHSYVVEDKIFCVHVAPDMETIMKHSAMACFPIDRVYEVKHMIDPSTV